MKKTLKRLFGAFLILCCIFTMLPMQTADAASKRKAITLKSHNSAKTVSSTGKYVIYNTSKSDQGFYFKANKDGYYKFVFSNLHRKGKKASATREEMALSFRPTAPDGVASTVPFYSTKSNSEVYLITLCSKGDYSRAVANADWSCLAFEITFHIAKGQSIFLQTGKNDNTKVYADLNISKVSKSKADSAVDMTVYSEAGQSDKDSDGEDYEEYEEGGSTENEGKNAKKVTSTADYKKAPAIKTGLSKVTSSTKDVTYVKFTSPSEGTYSFAVGNICDKGGNTAKDIVIASVGVKYEDNGMLNSLFYTNTDDGESLSTMYLESQYSWELNGSPSKFSSYDSAPTRYVSMNMKKGVTLYFEIITTGSKDKACESFYIEKQ